MHPLAQRKPRRLKIIIIIIWIVQEAERRVDEQQLDSAYQGS